jgi:hypothetical protein
VQKKVRRERNQEKKEELKEKKIEENNLLRAKQLSEHKQQTSALVECSAEVLTKEQKVLEYQDIKEFETNLDNLEQLTQEHFEYAKSAKKSEIYNILRKELDKGEYTNIASIQNTHRSSLYYCENIYINKCSESEEKLSYIETNVLAPIELQSLEDSVSSDTQTFIYEEDQLFDTSYYLIPFFFKDQLVRKLLGKIMKNGKKQLAARILQCIFLKVKHMTGISPIKILKSIFKMVNFIFWTSAQTTGTRTIQKPTFLTIKQRLFYIIGLFFKELKQLHLEDYVSIIDRFAYLVVRTFKTNHPTM